MRAPEGRDRFVDRLLFALAFLTRLPVPARIHEAGMPSFLGAIPLLLSGLFLGGTLALVSWLPTFLPRPPSPFLRALLLLFLWIALTGGLHLDGVADMTESALAPVSPEEKRRIRKDPRKGVYAIVALNLLILGKWTGLLLARPGMVALFLAPLLSRGFLPLVFRALARGRSEPSGGLGRLLLGESRGPALVSAFLSLLIALGAGGLRAAAASLLLLGGLTLVGNFLLKRSDGLSGDLAGFLIESGEVATLLLLSF
ncbi:MAG: adenosylcobinamide-GDP ribazoletransferase [Nitrospirae bacterium]|nr:adenosylcobinamide-GDP ribazoletransferase [Nitrospirota bacterium]